MSFEIHFSPSHSCKQFTQEYRQVDLIFMTIFQTNYRTCKNSDFSFPKVSELVSYQIELYTIGAKCIAIL